MKSENSPVELNDRVQYIKTKIDLFYRNIIV